MRAKAMVVVVSLTLGSLAGCLWKKSTGPRGTNIDPQAEIRDGDHKNRGRPIR